MANYGAGELNPWTSRVEAPHEPTGALVDVDPGTETTFAEVRQLARLYYTALDHLGLLGGPKVTRQSGLQLWIPVRRSYSFDDTRVWVERLSRAVGATLPEMVSWAWRKADRQGQARLHPEPVNKTLVAPVLRPAGAGRAGVGAHHLGRTRRPGAAARPLDDVRSASASPRWATRCATSWACSSPCQTCEVPPLRVRPYEPCADQLPRRGWIGEVRPNTRYTAPPLCTSRIARL
jgi:hypothetical protein